MKVGQLVMYFDPNYYIDTVAAIVVGEDWAVTERFQIRRLVDRKLICVRSSEIKTVSIDQLSPGDFRRLTTQEVLLLMGEKLNESR